MKILREQNLEHAQRRLRVGDAPGAARLADEALTEAPHLCRARLVAARAQLRLGQPHEALRSLDAVDWYADHAAPRTRLAARVVRAGALAQLDRTDEAIGELQAVLNNRPNHRGTALRLAALLLDSDRPDEAVAVLEHKRHRRGSDRASMRLLAEACERTGCYDRALTLRRRLYREGERGATAVRRIARLCVHADRIAEALTAFDALHDKVAFDTDAAHEASDLAERIGDTCRAMRYLEAALSIDTHDVRAAQRIAQLHLSCGRFADAARCYWRLSRREDDNGRGLGGLIITALCAGRYAMADRCLERYAVSYDTATRRAQMTELWLTATPGRLLNADDSLKESSDSRDVFAVLVADAGRTIDRELSRHPDYADLHFHRAVCRGSLGDTDGETESLDAALAINGGYVAAGCRRIDRALREGDVAKARRILTGLGERRSAEELSELSAKIAEYERHAA